MPGQDLPSEKKVEVLTLLGLKTMSVRQISRRTGVSKSSVARLAKSMTFKSKRRGKCGRKPTTTAKDDRILLRNLRRNPLHDANQLRAEWEKHGVNVSVRTVQRRLKTMCRSVIPRRVPKLTQTMKNKRLSFAKKHIQWSIEKWRRVCFSDESLFECKGAQRSRVWHIKGSPVPIRQTVKHPTKVMVWGMFCSKGPGKLYVVEGNMNATQYMKVLETRAIPQIQEWYSNGEAIYMHDGAPCHKAKVITEYLRSKEITTLDWPGNSPDLNPIENLWGVIKKRICSQTTNTKQELISSIIRHWHRDATLLQTLTNLIESMPRRLQAVIDAKGGHTKF